MKLLYGSSHELGIFEFDIPEPFGSTRVLVADDFAVPDRSNGFKVSSKGGLLSVFIEVADVNFGPWDILI